MVYASRSTLGLVVGLFLFASTAAADEQSECRAACVAKACADTCVAIETSKAGDLCSRSCFVSGKILPGSCVAAGSGFTCQLD